MPVFSIWKAMSVCLAIAIVPGCAEKGDTAPASPGLGTLGGAAAGGALGSLIGGGKGRVAAIVGGALLGGVAGNQVVDRPVEEQQRQQAEASRDRDMQRRLDYQRQSALQQDQVQREIQERKLFDEWKRERAGGTSASGSAAEGGADVAAAQRYLIALGYYNGRADGVAGPATQAAVQRFQADHGLTQTGVITPDLVMEMRRAL